MTEKAILNALIELEAAVKAMPASNPKPNLQTLFAKLDRLAEQLPADADPDLRHYLERKSYQKAKLLLEGRDAEKAAGGCR